MGGGKMASDMGDMCGYCGYVIEGRGLRRGRGLVHEDCLEEMMSLTGLLDFAWDHRDEVLRFLAEHLSDGFMDRFWEVFREEFELDIERWATS